MTASSVAHPPGTNARAPHLDIVNAPGLCKLISMPEAIELVAGAMQRLSGGMVDAPERWVTEVADRGLMALMPGSAPGAGRFGVKVLSLFEPSARLGLPGHQGLMLLFDRETGRPLTVIDANALTGLRTAAASAVATRMLARSDSGVLALIGCGEQAIWHAQAIPLVREIREVRVWGRSEVRARQFATRYLAHIPTVSVVKSVRDAIRGADVICTLTHSKEPLIAGEWLEEGQHLNLVGSSTAAFREVDDEAVQRSRFVVDSRANALSQAGEVVHAVNAGLIDEAHLHAEIGEVLAGIRSGRENATMITAYKSLGHIVQDLAVSDAVQRRLRDLHWIDRIGW